MRKSLFIVFLLMFSLLFFACNSKTFKAEPGIEGYVVEIEDGRFLVVSPVPEDFSSTGGVEEFYNAIWFSNAPNKVQIGLKVQVWFEEVAISYPGQSDAKKVSFVPSNKPNNAKLTEAEAIRKALTIHGNNKVPVIKSANYDAISDAWTIHIKQGEVESNVQIEDK
ncbi:DUF3221 domain-containing protein [Paenibacillus allorhizosphaerae]|uniref:DUF3221 domain-containing protein n=1 Tax=Paenibacillus allorhizosphaerae TaxID=2849866 RepID=A0ABM8VUG4_9BACL|nr:DUF3221 domain-containing protein [Paenibacillus allorhizosphaerae]CAG7658823.1 hypothetical protein PAECIP111802_07177 [Paenibacillus allorhizosphaerae]